MGARYATVGDQAVGQLDQVGVGLGPVFAFYVGHFFLYRGSILPNDRLHKIPHTLRSTTSAPAIRRSTI